MQTSTTIVTSLLPLSLAIIMFGLGLSLTMGDFTRVVKYPKAIVVGLICQMLILPALGLVICHMFNLSYEASVGVLILAASPGGITANLYSHLAGGNIALNLTLTAVNSILAAFSLPIIVNLAFQYFSSGKNVEIGLQFSKTVEVFAIVLIPVGLGMMINKWKPKFSSLAEKPVKIFSFFVLLVIVVGAILQQKDQLAVSFSQIGAAMLSFSIFSMAVGYVIPLLLKSDRAEAIAISMEVGIHNGTLAIYIALNLLNSFAFALPAAVYSILMFFMAGIFSLYLIKTRKTPQPSLG